jgi:hypothetical protein
MEETHMLVLAVIDDTLIAYEDTIAHAGTVESFSAMDEEEATKMLIFLTKKAHEAFATGEHLA